MKFFLKTFFFLLSIFLIVGRIQAAETVPVELEGVGLDEHLGKKLNLDREFTDEKGEKVPLRNFFDARRPVILLLVYYSCPNLCNFLLNGLTATLKQMPWTPGGPFQIVAVSIDPTEKPELAQKKKQAYLESYGRPDSEKGWHFLTGNEDSIRPLAQEVGFKYKYDPDQKQYAHAALLTVLTPEGVVSRYLYGIEFDPRDLKLALLEATQGKIGSWTDRLLMFCYHYDPKGRKYALMATRLMKLGGGITVLAVVVFLALLIRGKKRRFVMSHP